MINRMATPNESMNNHNMYKKRKPGIGVYWNISNNYSSKPSLKDHYKTLNLSRNCTSKEIKDAFITLSKKFHPDKNKDNPKAQQQFVAINEAYNVLIKKDSRKSYDSTLEYYGQPMTGSASTGKGGFYQVNRRDSGRDKYYQHRGPFYYSPQDTRGVKWQTRNKSLKWFMILAFGLVICIQVVRLITISRFTNFDNSEWERKIYRESSRKSTTEEQTSTDSKPSN